jgi:cell shape-determining protein MreD
MGRKIIFLAPLFFLIQGLTFFSFNLCLLSVLVFSFFKISIWYPFFVGILLDFFSEKLFGYYTLLAFLIYFLVNLLKKIF